MSRHDPRVTLIDIRHDVLWNAVQLEVPALLTTVERMLSDLESASGV